MSACHEAIISANKFKISALTRSVTAPKGIPKTLVIWVRVEGTGGYPKH